MADEPNDATRKDAQRADASPKSERPTEAVYDIPVRVSTVLGKSTIQISDLLELDSGAVVELDHKVGDPVEVYVNNQLVARGELMVADDRLGVTLTEIVRVPLGKA